MELVRISSLIGLILISGLLLGQNPKAHRLDIDIKNGSVQTLLVQIEEQTQLKFSYNTRLIRRDSIVNYTAKGQSVENVILELFSDRIKAKVIGNHIVLLENKKTKRKPKKVKAKADYHLIVFSGVLLNARNHKPIASASIYDISTRESFLTDSLGQFEISVMSNRTLKNYSIAKSTYQDTIISVDITAQESIEIKLLPLGEWIEKMDPKVDHLISAEEKSESLMGMVPKEALLASQNLDHIYEKRVGQVSFLPIVGTNLTASGIIENKVSLNILGGYNGGVKGFEIGGLFNVIENNVLGFQVGGLSNVVEGKTTGMQVAGLVNKTKKQVLGFQVGGIGNWTNDSITGFQVGGIANVNKGSVLGFQVGGISNANLGETTGMEVAGIVNISKGDVTGFQTAGISNLTDGDVVGLQIAGISNINLGKTEGLQVSGIYNHSGNQLNGVQISGAKNHVHDRMNGMQVSTINYAKVNNGFQFGLINSSDSSNGVSVGLVNYVKNGYHAIELSANEVTYTNLTFKSGARHFYNIYTVGAMINDSSIFSVGLGFGSSFKVFKKLSVSVDLTTNYIGKAEQIEEDINFITKLDLTFDYHLSEHFAVFLGPSYNIHISKFENKWADYFNSEIPISPVYEKTSQHSYLQIWFAGELGLRYVF